MHESQPNAFATGRNPARSAVAVSTGLMQMLSREELAGVIAHELALRNRDTLTMTVAATIAGAISSIVNLGLMFGGGRDRPNIVVTLLLVLVAPLAAAVIQMAISPLARGMRRTGSAPRSAASPCGSPRRWTRSRAASPICRTRRPRRGPPRRLSSSSIRSPAGR